MLLGRFGRLQLQGRPALLRDSDLPNHGILAFLDDWVEIPSKTCSINLPVDTWCCRVTCNDDTVRSPCFINGCSTVVLVACGPAGFRLRDHAKKPLNIRVVCETGTHNTSGRLLRNYLAAHGVLGREVLQVHWIVRLSSLLVGSC